MAHAERGGGREREGVWVQGEGEQERAVASAAQAVGAQQGALRGRKGGEDGVPRWEGRQRDKKKSGGGGRGHRGAVCGTRGACRVGGGAEGRLCTESRQWAGRALPTECGECLAPYMDPIAGPTSIDPCLSMPRPGPNRRATTSKLQARHPRWETRRRACVSPWPKMNSMGRVTAECYRKLAEQHRVGGRARSPLPPRTPFRDSSSGHATEGGAGHESRQRCIAPAGSSNWTVRTSCAADSSRSGPDQTGWASQGGSAQIFDFLNIPLS